MGDTAPGDDGSARRRFAETTLARTASKRWEASNCCSCPSPSSSSRSPRSSGAKHTGWSAHGRTVGGADDPPRVLLRILAEILCQICDSPLAAPRQQEQERE